MLTWWRGLLERRRAKHVSPWDAAEMQALRRKGWRLIRAGRP